MALVRNTIKFSSGGGSDIIVVANYSALPDPTTVSGQFYWCSASQGTSWLPGSLGGTYYNSGMYYSNGTTWEFINVPYQATQAEVNTGTNTDKFVTPETLKNQNYLATIAYADAKVEDTIVDGVTDKAPSQNAVFDALALKTDKSDWIDYSNSSTIVGWASYTAKLIFIKKLDANLSLVMFQISGVSNATTSSFTLDVEQKSILVSSQNVSIVNSGSASSTSGRVVMQVDSNIVDVRRDALGTAWSTSGTKTVTGQFFIKTA